MDYVDKIKTLLSTSIEETSYDNRMNQFMDQKMMDYIDRNMSDPNKKAQFIKAQQRYAKLAAKVNDPKEAEYFYWRMVLPEKQARILSNEFYARELRSGTDSDVSISGAGDEFSKMETIGYGNAFANKGMFTDLGAKGSTPGKTVETEDFFTKLFASKYLNAQDRIVLVTYLIFGIGPGLKSTNVSANSGIDLETIMDNPPAELKLVEDQITKLIKFGVENITASTVLQGAKKNDDPNSSIGVNPLVSTKRALVAQQNIQKAMKELVGTDDLTKIRLFMTGLTKNPMGAMESYSIEESDKNDIISTILDYISGTVVTKGNLSKAIVAGVELNIKKKTHLSKSKSFEGSVSKIAQKYLKMAEEGGELNIIKVQDMLLAPMLDSLEK